MRYTLARQALDIDPENDAAQRLADRLDEVMRYRGEEPPVVDGDAAEPVEADAAQRPDRRPQRRPRKARRLPRRALRRPPPQRARRRSRPSGDRRAPAPSLAPRPHSSPALTPVSFGA